jgi:hypothetical protein
MKEPKDEKLQVLLSSEDHHKLKRIILQYSMEKGKLMTTSSYVRALIKTHIRNFEGQQFSFAEEKVKEVIKQSNLEDKFYPEMFEEIKETKNK